jgi:hypothetical protein
MRAAQGQFSVCCLLKLCDSCVSSKLAQQNEWLAVNIAKATKQNKGEQQVKISI